MTTIKTLTLVALMTFATLMAGCAAQSAEKTTAPPPPVHSVYIWDADGHIDLTLLRGLKAAAADYFRMRGVTVTDDASATGAYVKISVNDADAEKGFVDARLYVLSAADNSMIYDRTYRAESGNGYPIDKFVRGALGGFFE
ncbi:MAG: hypothetical protein HZC51_06490 [Nitrospirae bacterium]|nr:hypothetical protein [Nitrospirota bacterium]